MAVHKAARFTHDPKLSHERAVHRISRYLKVIKDKDIIYNPNSKTGIEFYIDADLLVGGTRLNQGTLKPFYQEIVMY